MFVCAGKWLACQSMDNQIVVFNALNHFKFMRKKVFKGHMVAGYACGLDFSPEMRYYIGCACELPYCVSFRASLLRFSQLSLSIICKYFYLCLRV